MLNCIFQNIVNLANEKQKEALFTQKCKFFSGRNRMKHLSGFQAEFFFFHTEALRVFGVDSRNGNIVMLDISPFNP